MASLLRRLRIPLLVAGIATSAVAVLGLGLGWGDQTTRVAAAAPRPEPSASAQPSSSAPSSAPTRPERPAAFFAAFEKAVRSGDSGYLTARLHPDVIARYGRAQCQRFAAQLADPRATLRLVRVSGPQTYRYTSDGMSTSVPDTYAFDVTGTAAGTSGPRTYHFALVAGTFRSFSDCGKPAAS